MVETCHSEPEIKLQKYFDELSVTSLVDKTYDFR